MKRSKILIIAILSCFNLYCQNDTIDYAFLNSALTQVPTIKRDSDYFLLMNQTKIWGTRVTSSNSYKETENKIDTTTLKELVTKLNSTWKTVVLLDKKRISKKTKAKLVSVKKTWQIWEDISERKHVKKEIVFTCSMPVFDSKKEYAIIEIDGGFGSLAMQGWKCLFKKNENEWQLIAKFDNWCN